MTDILETLIQRLLKAEQRVAALERREYTSGGGGGDHGGLTGLADDDHSQYHNDTRGDARYALTAKGVTNGDSHDHSGGDGAQIDHGGLAGLGDDDHTQYVKKSTLDAKGDILVATANDTPARLAVGTNGYLLTAASGESTGLKWKQSNRCFCQAYHDADQTIATGGWRLIALNSEYYDYVGDGLTAMHDNSTNNSRVYARIAGVYLIAAELSIASNATGIRGIAVCLNSAGTLAAGNIIGVNSNVTNPSADSGYAISVPVLMSAGDYIEMFAYQNSGGDLAVKAYRYSPILSLSFIGS